MDPDIYSRHMDGWTNTHIYSTHIYREIDLVLHSPPPFPPTNSSSAHSPLSPVLHLDIHPYLGCDFLVVRSLPSRYGPLLFASHLHLPASFGGGFPVHFFLFFFSSSSFLSFSSLPRCFSPLGVLFTSLFWFCFFLVPPFL